MQNYFTKVIFKRLEIRKILDLNTNWRVSLERMSEIALKSIEPDVNLSELAIELYGDDSSHSIHRMGIFRDIMLSISHHGYRTRLEYSIEELQEVYPAGANTLPRVFNNGDIDDGRHRLTSMLANGYEEAVVAVCTTKRVPISESREDAHNAVHQDIIDAIKEFRKSELYIAWKNKEGYKHD